MKEEKVKTQRCYLRKSVVGGTPDGAAAAGVGGAAAASGVPEEAGVDGCSGAWAGMVKERRERG